MAGHRSDPRPSPDAPEVVTPGPPARALRRDTDPAESRRASRHWWDGEATSYQREHDAVLGDARLMWGPEGVYEDDLGLLGPVAGLRVLEFGSGAAAGARWCLQQRATGAVALDLSAAMLQHGRGVDRRSRTAGPDDGSSPVYLQADALALPLAEDSVDVSFSAYGALPFVADPGQLLGQVARVTRPGGRVVFSVSHPLRWCFPDVPGEEGLTAHHSYFDRAAYVEEDDAGQAGYVEHHHTVGDVVRAIHSAGLRLLDLVEPEWPAASTHSWGGWSELRGSVLPGTAIFVAVVDPALDRVESTPR